jgi:hypothetical protein
MFRGAIHHKGTWLMPGSQSHKLKTEGKSKELDALDKQIDETWRRVLASDPTTKTPRSA